MTIKNKSLKEKVKFYLDDEKTFAGRFVDFFIVSLSLISVIVFIIESYYHDANPLFFWYVEITIVSIFIVEYLLRLWTADNKIKHITGIYSIIDLVSILPVFVTSSNLRFFRILRVFRIFRLMRFLESRSFFAENTKLHQIRIVRIIFTISTIIFIFSAFIYEVEKAANPDIDSLGNAIYFSVVTLATVGYGDISPITPLGRFVTTIMILISVALIPWQFTLLIKEVLFSVSGKRTVTCKKCGLRQHDYDAVHCKHCGNIIYQQIDSI